MKRGDLVKITCWSGFGLGKNRRNSTYWGIVVSYVPEAQNIFDKIADIRLMISTGELRDLILFHGDEVEILGDSQGTDPVQNPRRG